MLSLISKVALVSDSSAGIGYETALVLSRNGYDTYAGIRDLTLARELLHVAKEEKLPLRIIQLDVNSDSSVNLGVKKVLKEQNTIDLLVNNLGYILLGCFEDVSMNEMKAQFETNFYGTVRTAQAVLPVMRKHKSGIIINISSIAGRIGFPVASAFVSSQFAVEGLSESMRFELEPLGIYVSIIEPGMVRITNFSNSMVIANNAKKSSSPYSKITRKLTGNIEQMIEMGISPEEVADTILKAVQSKPPLPRYLVGNDAAMITENRKSMTDIEFEKFLKNTILNA
jgi:NAD(P)-dependent dehydrogenase (short-subunit alcohol dehydrogenase family)